MQVHQTPTVLLTRPRPASERFARALGYANVVIAPLMEIKGLGATVQFDGVKGLILTSEAAVAFLPPTSLPAFCVGHRTTAAAKSAGMQAECVGQDAEGLVAALARNMPAGPLLHLHGTHTRGNIAKRLCDIGLTAQSVAIYDQQEVPPSPAFQAALTLPNLIVPLFSPRSAKLFVRAVTGLRPDTKIIALSQAVADALPDTMAAQTLIAAQPTGKEMHRVMERFGVQKNSP